MASIQPGDHYPLISINQSVDQSVSLCLSLASALGCQSQGHWFDSHLPGIHWDLTRTAVSSYIISALHLISVLVSVQHQPHVRKLQMMYNKIDKQYLSN